LQLSQTDANAKADISGEETLGDKLGTTGPVSRRAMWQEKPEWRGVKLLLAIWDVRERYSQQLAFSLLRSRSRSYYHSSFSGSAT